MIAAQVANILLEAETIVAVATRFPSGHVYLDVSHADAVDKGLSAEPFKSANNFEALNDLAPEDFNGFMARLEHGFMTSGGRFVGREEAFQIAKTAGQNPETEIPGELHSLDYKD